VLKALYVELSVEPAPPGEWRVLQLDARFYESEVERAREQHLQQDLAAHVGHDSVDVELAKRVVGTVFQESAARAEADTALAIPVRLQRPARSSSHREVAEEPARVFPDLRNSHAEQIPNVGRRALITGAALTTVAAVRAQNPTPPLSW
jgi:hypothetical protein